MSGIYHYNVILKINVWNSKKLSFSLWKGHFYGPPGVKKVQINFPYWHENSKLTLDLQDAVWDCEKYIFKASSSVEFSDESNEGICEVLEKKKWEKLF